MKKLALLFVTVLSYVAYGQDGNLENNPDRDRVKEVRIEESRNSLTSVSTLNSTETTGAQLYKFGSQLDVGLIFGSKKGEEDVRTTQQSNPETYNYTDESDNLTFVSQAVFPLAGSNIKFFGAFQLVSEDNEIKDTDSSGTEVAESERGYSALAAGLLYELANQFSFALELDYLSLKIDPSKASDYNFDFFFVIPSVVYFQENFELAVAYTFPSQGKDKGIKLKKPAVFLLNGRYHFLENYGLGFELSQTYSKETLDEETRKDYQDQTDFKLFAELFFFEGRSHSILGLEFLGESFKNHERGLDGSTLATNKISVDSDYKWTSEISSGISISYEEGIDDYGDGNFQRDYFTKETEISLRGGYVF